MKRLLAMILGWGAPGLFAIAFLDGAGLTIPGGVDALIIYLASQMPQSMWLLIVLATTGSILGNLILFSLARKGGELYIQRHTLSRGGRKFRGWFQHYGMLTVFIAALVPLPVMPMKIFVVCSGALGSRVRAFVLTFVSARILRYTALAYLGVSMGDHALDYIKQHVWQLVGFAVLLLIILFGVVKFADHLKARATAASV
jgi:membrane protein YqaA with SNARE-associated domain